VRARATQLPETDLEVLFTAGLVSINNARNGTVVIMRPDEWSELAERARYLRAQAQPVELPEFERPS
jgi:hypothetical protein